MAANIQEVADLASVSLGTVSNVLNHPEKVSPATMARVNAAISELGFVRNDAARQLREGSSRSLGLVVLDASNPFFNEVSRGAEDRALEDGFTVIIGNSNHDAARERAFVDLFQEQRVRGVLLSPIADDPKITAELARRGIHVVLVDRTSSDDAISSVSVDDVQGGYLAVAHLLGTGRRRICFVGDQGGLRQVADRLIGARKAIAEVPGATIEVIPTAGMGVLQGRRCAAQIASLPPDHRPDAIFAANDLLALGLLQGLVMMGQISVPDDIAIIGYDDNPFSESAVVPLSTISQPARQLGASAVDLILRQATSPPPVQGTQAERIVFAPELVIRSST